MVFHKPLKLISWKVEPTWDWCESFLESLQRINVKNSNLLQTNEAQKQKISFYYLKRFDLKILNYLDLKNKLRGVLMYFLEVRSAFQLNVIGLTHLAKCTFHDWTTKRRNEGNQVRPKVSLEIHMYSWRGHTIKCFQWFSNF